MISGFFDTIQKDFDTVLNTNPARATSQSAREELELAVSFASMRVFGAVCMGLGALIAFSAAPTFLLTGAISQLVAGVVTYVIGYDLFKLSANGEKHLNSLVEKFRGIGHFLLNGGSEMARRQYHVNKLTEGMFLQFIAAPLLLNVVNKQIDNQMRDQVRNQARNFGINL